MQPNENPTNQSSQPLAVPDAAMPTSPNQPGLNTNPPASRRRLKIVLIIVAGLVIVPFSALLAIGLIVGPNDESSQFNTTQSDGAIITNSECDFQFKAPEDYGPTSDRINQGEFCIYGYTKNDGQEEIEYLISPENSKTRTTYSSDKVSIEEQTVNGQAVKVTKIDERQANENLVKGTKNSEYRVEYRFNLNTKTSTGNDLLRFSLTLYTLSGEHISDERISSFIKEADAFASTIKIE